MGCQGKEALGVTEEEEKIACVESSDHGGSERSVEMIPAGVQGKKEVFHGRSPRRERRRVVELTLDIGR